MGLCSYRVSCLTEPLRKIMLHAATVPSAVCIESWLFLIADMQVWSLSTVLHLLVWLLLLRL